MRVAIVHEYVNHLGGGERVLLELMRMFPTAPVYMLLHDPSVSEGVFDTSRFRTSFLQHIPFARSRHRLFPIMMPIGIEQFDLSRYDLVISASHSFGKGVITRPDTLHVSYCYTPMRFVWDDSHRYVREFGVPSFVRAVIPGALTYVRLWDLFASRRVDSYIANSKYVSRRIRKYYGREASVQYPPVACSRFKPVPQSAVSDRYLVVSRLLPYKRIDIAIEAFNELRLPLDIVGTGPENDRLRSMAGSTIRFHGYLPDEEVRRMYSRCRAFVFPQEEDFGITAVEAAASGRPVIAYAGGGALETVVDGKTGVLFPEQTAEELASAVRRCIRQEFDTNQIRSHALQFDTSQFTVGFMNHLQHAWSNFPAKRINTPLFARSGVTT